MITLSSQADVAEFRSLIQTVVDRHEFAPRKKSSERILTKALAQELSSAGFQVDSKDKRRLMPRGISVWRNCDGIEPTKGRREIDMIAYRDGKVVAFLESEESINDVRASPIPRGYFVWSIAKNSAGSYFSSYRSIERMAVAAYIAKYGPECHEEKLAALHSDSSADHNPLGIPMFITLACGWNDSGTRRRGDILKPRLSSLGCEIIARE